MDANGGTINFSGKCHNIKLTMGEYVLNSPIPSIPMGGASVVLGVQWLLYLGTVAFNFQVLFWKKNSEGKDFELWGITGKVGKIISYNIMTISSYCRGVSWCISFSFEVSCSFSSSSSQ